MSPAKFIVHINIKLLKWLRTKVCSVDSEDAETKHSHIWPGDKFQDFKSNKMVPPYFSRISHRLKKKRRSGCHKTKLGNRHLVLIVEKNEIWPHFTCWAYSKQLLLMLRLKKIFNDDALFEGAVCKDCRLTSCTVVYKRLKKSGSCHNVSRNVKSYVTHQTHCCSLKWPELNLYFSSYVFDINQVN